MSIFNKLKRNINFIDKRIKKSFQKSSFNNNIFKDKRTRNSLVQVKNKQIFSHPGYIKEKDGFNRSVTHLTAFPGLNTDVRLRTEYNNKEPKVRISSVSYKSEFNDLFLNNQKNYDDFKIGLREIAKIDKLKKDTPVEVWEDTYGSPKIGVIGDFIGKDRKRRSMEKEKNYFTQMQGESFMGMASPLKNQDRAKIMLVEARDSDLDLEKFNKQYWKEIMQEKPISKEMPDFIAKPNKEEFKLAVPTREPITPTVSSKNIPKQYKDDSINVTIPEKFRQPRQIKEYKFVPEEKVYNEEKRWQCDVCGTVDYDIKRPNRSVSTRHKCDWRLIDKDESEDRKIYKADGKDVIYKGKKGVKYPSPKFLDKVYKKIPDDKSVPVVLQTPKQYLKEYISN